MLGNYLYWLCIERPIKKKLYSNLFAKNNGYVVSSLHTNIWLQNQAQEF